MGMNAQSLIGAWERYHTSENGEKLKSVVTFADGYQVLTTYNANSGKFIHSNGGTWQLDGDLMTELVEFNTDDSDRVGTESSFKIKLTEATLSIVDSEMHFQRLDHGAPGKLQGAWLMSGRVRDGVTQSRDTSGPRKTMKILSGTLFQWIAYNTETKQFMGTGGGSYTTIDDKYTENIVFFSRDDSRVGASLEFNYQLLDGNWHHSGFSSKGDPLYEIWSLRK
tara:strand:- start:891 stop:1559 length:669 start_codon:yes stop_codon:yes gene_type:complete